MFWSLKSSKFWNGPNPSIETETFAAVHSAPSPCESLQPPFSLSLSLCLLPEQFYVFFYSSLAAPELNQPHKLKRCTNKFGPNPIFIIFFRLLLVAKTKYQQTHHIFFNPYSLVSTSSPDQEPKALSQPLKRKLWFFNLNGMVETKVPSKEKRGFYVKMRLLHAKNGRVQEKSCFFKYYKWFLWLSLSLYLFSSYFITNNNPPNKPTPLTKTHVSNAKTILASRALFESTNASHLQESTDDQGSKFNHFFFLSHILAQKFQPLLPT